MRVVFVAGFLRELRKFSSPTQGKFRHQLGYLMTDLRHPSLHAKKYDATRGIWQARVNRDVRFYFAIDDDTYVILRIRHHPK